MARRRDGRFGVTITLATDRSYRYRYLRQNDWAADDYAARDFGGEDSLLRL